MDLMTSKKMSIIDIWEVYHKNKASFPSCKLYFRVDQTAKENESVASPSVGPKLSMFKTPTIPNKDVRRSSILPPRRNSELQVSNPSYENSG
mmetsp:Transcript_10539/g.16127  ORF Transcript_10539/g.16127 Transcript_10539/m.16127 type:complete len:92 (-) Transcript_10539:1214-1489(-)